MSVAALWLCLIAVLVGEAESRSLLHHCRWCVLWIISLNRTQQDSVLGHKPSKMQAMSYLLNGAIGSRQLC